MRARLARLHAFAASSRSISIDAEWDPEKNASNIRKHGVSFQEAGTVFLDAHSVTIIDAASTAMAGESRLVTIGQSSIGRLIVVVHTERGDRLRVISARRPTRRETQEYESSRR